MISGIIVGLIWVISGLSNQIETIYAVIVVSYGVGIITTLLTSKKENAIQA
jgi:hypothetical protein